MKLTQLIGKDFFAMQIVVATGTLKAGKFQNVQN
jgi:hypothetical protein